MKKRWRKVNVVIDESIDDDNVFYGLVFQLLKNGSFSISAIDIYMMGFLLQ